MTLLAVVGLVAAATVARTASSRNAEAEELRATVVDLTARNDELTARNDELEAQSQLSQLSEQDRGIDPPPCLGRSPDRKVTRLLRVTVDRGYRVEQLWRSDNFADAADLPGFLKAQPSNDLSRAEFLRLGERIFRYGDRENAFGRRCRFYVELKRGPTISAARYVDASVLVEKYFFFTNSSEVNRERVRRE